MLIVDFQAGTWISKMDHVFPSLLCLRTCQAWAWTLYAWLWKLKLAHEFYARSRFSQLDHDCLSLSMDLSTFNMIFVCWIMIFMPDHEFPSLSMDLSSLSIIFGCWIMDFHAGSWIFILDFQAWALIFKLYHENLRWIMNF